MQNNIQNLYVSQLNDFDLNLAMPVKIKKALPLNEDRYGDLRVYMFNS